MNNRPATRLGAHRATRFQFGMGLLLWSSMTSVLPVGAFACTADPQSSAISDWPRDLPLQFVARQMLPDGRVQLVQRFVAPNAPGATLERLLQQAGELSGRSPIRQDRSAQWMILSFWHQQCLVIAQLRPATGGQATEGFITVTSLDRLMPGTNPSNTARSLGLPSLEQASRQVWRDADRQVTAILGWLPVAPDRARQQIIEAAANASLRLVHSAVAPGINGGTVLSFVGHQRELLVTLTPDRTRIGVVAYLSETNP